MEFSIILEMSVVRFLHSFSFILHFEVWTDPRLVWIPEQYNNMTHLYTTLEEVWFPNFHPCDSSVPDFLQIYVYFSMSSIAYLAQDNNQVTKVYIIHIIHYSYRFADIS